MTTTATHWMANCLATDQWTDEPSGSPMEAAEAFLTIGPVDNDECWHSWNELQDNESTKIVLRGYVLTTELIEEPHKQFDGYSPGCEWYKATDETRTVVVSLRYEMEVGP